MMLNPIQIRRRIIIQHLSASVGVKRKIKQHKLLFIKVNEMAW